MAAKILIVDDAPDFIFALRNFLEDLGYEVVEAYDGQEALKAIEAEQPDLVLLDVIMPIMDGWQTLSAIRERPEWQTLPVVMLTGLDQPEHIAESYGRGCTDFVVKQATDFDQLALVIERLLEVAKRMKEEQG